MTALTGNDTMRAYLALDDNNTWRRQVTPQVPDIPEKMEPGTLDNASLSLKAEHVMGLYAYLSIGGWPESKKTHTDKLCDKLFAAVSSMELPTKLSLIRSSAVYCIDYPLWIDDEGSDIRSRLYQSWRGRFDAGVHTLTLVSCKGDVKNESYRWCALWNYTQVLTAFASHLSHDAMSKLCATVRLLLVWTKGKHETDKPTDWIIQRFHTILIPSLPHA